MADPQFIKSPSGDELVVLSRADYDAMLDALANAEEDAADVAIYDKRKAELATLTEAGKLPQDVANYLLRGDNRITAFRKWRGFTQMEVAEKAGIAQSYLSALENKSRTGTAETLKAIAKALDVPADWIG